MQDPLAQQPIVPTLSLISNTRVANVLPTVDVPYRLAIIGEAPGADEVGYGIPFVGASGKFLDSILASSQILRAGCFIGNICKYQPPGNNFNEFGYDHPKVQEGWRELQSELDEFKPNCILALGNVPLHFLTTKTGITKWRGSILNTEKYKVVPSIHPAAVLRSYSDWPLLRFDSQRARQESNSRDYSVPTHETLTDLSYDEICHRLDSWPAGLKLAFDIEGFINCWKCSSVAGHINSGFIIAWNRHSLQEQVRLIRSLANVLYRLDVPKVLQNSLYDRFVLAYRYHILIRNVAEDTMDKSWAIYSELSRGLSTITSIWTRVPNYKDELMIYSDKKLKDQIKAGTYDESRAQQNEYKGCIMDSCVTLESCLAMDNALSEQERRHYKFNVGLKNSILYMQLRGIAYDSERAKTELAIVLSQLSECATRIMLRVHPMQFTKKELTNDIRGAGGSLSDKRLAKVLYEQKKYEVQYKGRGVNRKVSTNAESLLRLCEKHPDDPFLADVLLHRKLESTRECLDWKTDPRDGRIKCSYNQFSKGEDGVEEGGGATETGRLRCSQSIIPTEDTQVGGNLQTVTKKLRKLYHADDGYWFFQCDLAGADGWTVAAHCLKHGDPTMWDDYMFGLKPALIMTLNYLGIANAQTSREELKKLSRAYKQWEKEHEDEAWVYFGFKRVQHGTNYGMKEKTMSTQIMSDSYKLTGKPIYIHPSVCAQFQRLYLVRYSGIYRWHQACANEVATDKNLTSASGHTRKFFGRRRSWNPRTRSMEADHDTWKEWLADEPQENTSHATNTAIDKLWRDPENRGQLGLIIQPLHQVHDAMLGQFPKEMTSWCVPRIATYFDNPMQIANTLVTIPFEGAYGPSWGELGPEYGGGTI